MARKRPVSVLAPSLVPTGLIGFVAILGLGGCENSDVCEGLRSFDPPPEPDPSPSAPPLVIGGEWIGAGVLELSFSKPLTQGSAPDPSRFAVLGWAAQVQPYDAYSGPEVCYVRTRYVTIGGQGYYYSSASVVDVWVAPEDPTLLRLRMSSVAATCSTIPDTVAEGVMLVYTNGEGGNLLLDEEGDPVPDLGPTWAIQQLDGCSGAYYYCGALNQTMGDHLPSVNSLAMIPCP
jgi:hypothetical protein